MTDTNRLLSDISTALKLLNDISSDISGTEHEDTAYDECLNAISALETLEEILAEEVAS